MIFCQGVIVDCDFCQGLIVRGEKKMKGVWEEGELVGYLIAVGDRFSS